MPCFGTHTLETSGIYVFFLDQATNCKRKSRVVRSSCNGECFRGTFSSSPVACHAEEFIQNDGH